MPEIFIKLQTKHMQTKPQIIAELEKNKVYLLILHKKYVYFRLFM